MRKHMRQFLCFVFTLCAMGVIVSPIFAFTGGPPYGFTGSPDDGFRTCRSDACHDTFALNSGTATFSIAAPSTYKLGEAVDITVSFSNSNTPKHGFELSALDAHNNHSGTVSNVDNKTQIIEASHF